MCQILNGDMCKSLPQHFGFPTQFKYACACTVCVCENEMIDDKEDESKEGCWGVSF